MLPDKFLYPSIKRVLLVFVILWLIFQVAYYSGHSLSQHSYQQQTIAAIETRIALDLPGLKLANERLNSVAHQPSIKAYLERINDVLRQQQSPFQVIRLQQVELTPELYGDKTLRVLAAPDQNIEVELVRVSDNAWFHWLPLTTAMLFCIFAGPILLRKNTASAPPKQKCAKNSPNKLVINLNNKSLTHGADRREIYLANKPFCFYAALVDYCLNQQAPYLNSANEVPEQIVNLANKYFFRLIALGHTKRKKPDFSTNLDKTLSEIRAALDELYQDCPEIKQFFYPPKAQGEGSRSRRHNFALENIQPDQVEFVGR